MISREEVVLTHHVETLGRDAGKTILRASAVKNGQEYGLEEVCAGPEPTLQERENLLRKFCPTVPA